MGEFVASQSEMPRDLGASGYSSLATTTAFYERKWEEGVAYARTATELEPYYSFCQHVYGMSQRRFTAALEQAEQCQTDSLDPLGLSVLGTYLAYLNRREEALKIVATLEQMAEAGYVELHAIAQVHIALGNIGQAMESVNKSLDERGLFRPFSNSTRNSIHCARTPRTDHRLLEERLEQCHKGETIRGVESRRIDKSGREHKGLLTLSLLTDERGAPERSP